MNLTQSSAGFFYNLIEILGDNFRIHSQDDLSLFSQAVKEYAYFIVQVDNLVDGQKEFWENATRENPLFMLSKTHEMALRKLYSLFPPDSPFWLSLDKNSKIYFDTLFKERENNMYRLPFSIIEYEKICLGKHALANVAVDGLGILFNPIHENIPLNEILNEIYVAMQFSDDIDDFDKDENLNQWNYVQYETDNFINENNLYTDNDDKDFRKKVFYVSGLAYEHTEIALKKYEHAKQLIDEYKLKNLGSWINHTIEITQHNLSIANKLRS